MNAVAQLLADRHDELDLARFGLPARPACVVLTPSFRLSRHVIVLVLGRDGAPVLVGKLPRLAGDGVALAREAQSLRTVAEALGGAGAGTVPELVAHVEDGPHPLLLETALAGTPLSPALIRRERADSIAIVARWLEAVALGSAVPAAGDWYERLVALPLRELGESAGAEVVTLARRTPEVAEALRGAGLPLVLEHGDLGHPNVLRQGDGRLGVLDWESGEPTGLPCHDLIFFLAYAAAAGRKSIAGIDEPFFGMRRWAWPALDHHARRLAIDPALLPALIAVCSARAVHRAGAVAPAPAPHARDAAARHLVLWRAALDHHDRGARATTGARAAGAGRS